MAGPAPANLKRCRDLCFRIQGGFFGNAARRYFAGSAQEKVAYSGCVDFGHSDLFDSQPDPEYVLFFPQT